MPPISDPFAYEFGVAIANWQQYDINPASVVELVQQAGATGSNAQRDALIGAFDEFLRIAWIYLPDEHKKLYRAR